jgi:hypothetical protein
MPAATTTMSVIRDAVAGIERALEAENDPATFDSEVSMYTNRGNKLKRKAEFSRQGHLGGQRPYKKVGRNE